MIENINLHYIHPCTIYSFLRHLKGNFRIRCHVQHQWMNKSNFKFSFSLKKLTERNYIFELTELFYVIIIQ